MNPANDADRPMPRRSMTTDTDTVSVAKPTTPMGRELLQMDTSELMKILKGKAKASSMESLKNFVTGK